MSLIKFVEPYVDYGEAPAVDLFSRSWAKLASSTYTPPEVEAFLKTARPIPGHRLLLVHGLGSSEYYGPNRNGDAFPEMWKGAKNLIEDNADRGYGFKTFEKNAHTFRDHRNHDPALTIGGKVVLAAWNDKMHRVELIIPVSETLAGDVVDAIDKGEKIAVSMGCFIAGTRITMADGRAVAIEDIVVGDEVMTHLGRGRRVTELHRRLYDGTFYVIYTDNTEPFVCTKEHPLLVVERDYARRFGCEFGVQDINAIPSQWVHAECLDPTQHLLVVPVLEDALVGPRVNGAPQHRSALFTPVRAINPYTTVQDVFNFEVEEDESYVAAGVAVHNCRVPYDVCSICGNKAKHRGQYCKHAAHQMNAVLDDGRKVYVDNPQPNFFDISVLGYRGQGRPADPSAYSIMKVASHSAGKRADETKKSDIDKKVPAEAVEVKPGVSGDPLHQDEFRHLMELVRKFIPYDMDTMSNPGTKCVIVIRRLSTRPEGKVAALSTLTAAGVILRPQLLMDLGLADTPIDLTKIATPLLAELREDLHNCSLWLPYFGDRVLRNHKLGVAVQAADAGRNPGVYLSYINRVKTALSTRSELKKLAETVDANSMLKAAIARDDLVDLQKYANKTKGLSAENLVAAMLAPLLAGAYFRSQQYSGLPVGPLRSFIADHPVATGTLSALLWHKLKGGRIPLLQS